MPSLRSSIEFRALLAAFASVLWILVWQSPVDAGIPPVDRHKVVIMPSSLPLYLSLGSPPIEGMLDRDALHSAIERHFVDQPYFELVPFDAAETLLLESNERRRSLQDAREYLGLGETFFFNYDLDNAINMLKRAEQGFRDSFGALIAREDTARAYQYLAFALLEKSARDPDGLSRADAQTALRNLVRHAPDIVLDPERQPEDRVATYTEARRSFLTIAELRQHTREDADSLASALHVDFVLFPRIVQNETGELTFELDIYDHSQDRMEYPTVSLPQTADRDLTERAVDRIDAMLSRFTSCIEPKPLPIPEQEGEAGRVYLDTGFAYYVFLESPTTSPFDNIGAMFAVTYMFTDNLSVAGRFGLAFSGGDKESDLRSTFNTFRGNISLGVSADFEWIRPYFYSGIEVAQPTAFIVTNNQTCKIFDVDDEFCPPGAVHSFDIDALTGLSAAAGFAIGIDPVFVTTEASFAFYVLPTDIGKDLNFPIGFDLGLEYRF